MKTKILMFCMLAAIAIFSANSFAGNKNEAASNEVKSEKVDQDVDPKSMNWIFFDNQTGTGQAGSLRVNYSTMNMSFGSAASDWLYASRMPGKYTDYKFYNSKGQLLSFNANCSSQDVYHGSTVTVRM